MLINSEVSTHAVMMLIEIKLFGWGFLKKGMVTT